MIEDCIRQMARKHKTTRFIKLHYHDAEMEPAGVPAVLAYRGGDKFAGLVPVVDELPDDADLSPETLEKVFERCVLPPPFFWGSFVPSGSVSSTFGDRVC